MPGEAGLDECGGDILAICKDAGDEPAVAIGFLDSDGDGLPIHQTGCEFLGLGAEGVAGFGAVDAFQADFCLPAVTEDLNSVARG